MEPTLHPGRALLLRLARKLAQWADALQAKAQSGGAGAQPLRRPPLAAEPLSAEEIPPAGGPPAHWIERVRQAAPQLLATPTPILPARALPPTPASAPAPAPNAGAPPRRARPPAPSSELSPSQRAAAKPRGPWLTAASAVAPSALLSAQPGPPESQRSRVTAAADRAGQHGRHAPAPLSREQAQTASASVPAFVRQESPQHEPWAGDDARTKPAAPEFLSRTSPPSPASAPDQGTAATRRIGLPPVTLSSPQSRHGSPELSPNPAVASVRARTRDLQPRWPSAPAFADSGNSALASPPAETGLGTRGLNGVPEMAPAASRAGDLRPRPGEAADASWTQVARGRGASARPEAAPVHTGTREASVARAVSADPFFDRSAQRWPEWAVPAAPDALGEWQALSRAQEQRRRLRDEQEGLPWIE